MDLQGVFVKIRDFIKFKGFLVELQSRRSWENQKTHRKSPEKWIFLSLAFYNAPSLDTVDYCPGGRIKEVWALKEIAHKNREVGGPSREAQAVNLALAACKIPVVQFTIPKGPIIEKIKSRL